MHSRETARLQLKDRGFPAEASGVTQKLAAALVTRQAFLNNSKLQWNTHMASTGTSRCKHLMLLSGVRARMDYEQKWPRHGTEPVCTPGHSPTSGRGFNLTLLGPRRQWKPVDNNRTCLPQKGEG